MNTREITKKLSEEQQQPDKNSLYNTGEFTTFNFGKGYMPKNKNLTNNIDRKVSLNIKEYSQLKHNPDLKYDPAFGYYYEVENKNIDNNIEIKETSSGRRITLSPKKS
jgi:hypothetical protein